MRVPLCSIAVVTATGCAPMYLPLSANLPLQQRRGDLHAGAGVGYTFASASAAAEPDAFPAGLRAGGSLDVGYGASRGAFDVKAGLQRRRLQDLHAISANTGWHGDLEPRGYVLGAVERHARRWFRARVQDAGRRPAALAPGQAAQRQHRKTL